MDVLTFGWDLTFDQWVWLGAVVVLTPFVLYQLWIGGEVVGRAVRHWWRRRRGEPGPGSIPGMHQHWRGGREDDDQDERGRGEGGGR
jgi:hypothetical protein